MNIIDTIVKVGFHLHIGDPNGIGWIITVSYFIASITCFIVGYVIVKDKSLNQNNESYIFWFGLALFLLALGINKQLDLQSWITLVGREYAKANGWYEKRREVQAIFIMIIASVSLIGIVLILWWLKNHWRKYSIVILGLVFLIFYVLIRASSFYHVNYLFNSYRKIGPFRLKYYIEIVGILLVEFAAVRNIFRIKK